MPAAFAKKREWFERNEAAQGANEDGLDRRTRIVVGEDHCSENELTRCSTPDAFEEHVEGRHGRDVDDEIRNLLDFCHQLGVNDGGDNHERYHNQEDCQIVEHERQEAASMSGERQFIERVLRLHRRVWGLVGVELLAH